MTNRLLPEAAAPALLWSTVDLVRCCCSHEQYDAWMERYGLALGAAGIAHYFACAAQAFEEQSYAALWRRESFNEWAARECLADRLMASAPLRGEELRQAAARTVREIRREARRPEPPIQTDDLPGEKAHG